MEIQWGASSWLAQAEAPKGKANGGDGAGPGVRGCGGGGLGGLFPPLMAIILVFYFLILRPQRRQEQTRRDMLGALKKNDHVVTIGGIYGIVTNIKPEDDEVTIRVDDATGTKLRVTRSSIARIVSAASEEAPKTGKS